MFGNSGTNGAFLDSVYYTPYRTTMQVVRHLAEQGHLAGNLRSSVSRVTQAAGDPQPTVR